MGLFTKKPQPIQQPVQQPIREAQVSVVNTEESVENEPEITTVKSVPVKKVVPIPTSIPQQQFEEYDESMDENLPAEDEVKELEQLEETDISEPSSESVSETVSTDTEELTEEMVKNALLNLHNRVTNLEAKFFRIKESF
jgi:hypothetical protein